MLDPKHGNLAGVSHYVFFLMKHLLRIESRHEWVGFFDASLEGPVPFASDRLTPVLIRRDVRAWRRHWNFLQAVKSARCDVVHGPANGLPIGYRGRTVLTIHDLAIYRHPEWFPSGQWFGTRVHVPYSIRVADRIIAVSKSTQEELQSIFPSSKRKIRVVHEGVEDPREISNVEAWRRFCATRGIGEQFILFVGTLEPRKNIVQLVQAFDALLESRSDLRGTQLVLAGGWGWKSDPIRKSVMDANWGNQIKVLGYVEDDMKEHLYRNATLFVYPSLWEGFGLPVVEAMRRGVPVVTSSAGALSEVGGGAVMYVDTNDTDALVRAIQKVLKSPNIRRDLSEKGAERAKHFSWERCALETLNIYETVARKRR